VFLYLFDLRSIRSITYLFCFFCLITGCALYESHVGKVAVLFFLPMSCLLYQTLLETRSLWMRLLLLLALVILVNFFPQYGKIESVYGVSKQVYSVLFNNIYVNPLGWEKCGMTEVRDEILKIMNQRLFAHKKPFYMLLGHSGFTEHQLNFYFKFTYNIPLFTNLQNSAQKVLLSNFAAFKADKDKYLHSWLNSSKVPVIIRIDRPWEEPLFRLDESLQWLEGDPRSAQFDHFGLGAKVQMEYWNYLKRENR